mmetsp:Transcript_5149/g.12315  ORF Transcript_5149/g.12315 Transcript_5149/m.12315 type:complete len:182 (-) Transcript_5149:203-748(-)
MAHVYLFRRFFMSKSNYDIYSTNRSRTGWAQLPVPTRSQQIHHPLKLGDEAFIFYMDHGAMLPFHHPHCTFNCHFAPIHTSKGAGNLNSAPALCSTAQPSTSAPAADSLLFHYNNPSQFELAMDGHFQGCWSLGSKGAENSKLDLPAFSVLSLARHVGKGVLIPARRRAHASVSDCVSRTL